MELTNTLYGKYLWPDYTALRRPWPSSSIYHKKDQSKKGSHNSIFPDMFQKYSKEVLEGSSQTLAALFSKQGGAVHLEGMDRPIL